LFLYENTVHFSTFIPYENKVYQIPAKPQFSRSTIYGSYWLGNTVLLYSTFSIFNIYIQSKIFYHGVKVCTIKLTFISNFELFIYLFYWCFTSQVLKVHRTPGPTACLTLLNKVCLKIWRKEKKFHDWTWAALNLQIYAQMLTEVYQWSGIFSKLFSCISMQKL